MSEFEIISEDGLRLVGYDWPSYRNSRSPYAVVILVHGLAEHCGRYEYLINYFNENNIAVVTMDLRGHGYSEGETVFIPSEQCIFRDIDLLIEEARNRYQSCPAILYGHSMGGNFVLSYTLNRYSHVSYQCPYQAMIVSSPWIRLTGFLQPPRFINTVVQKLSSINPMMKFPLHFNPSRITRDPVIAQSYMNDPYIRRTATLSLAQIVGNMAQKLDRIKPIFHIPVLLQHGDADALTSHRASAKFAARGTNIEFKNWPHCFHELHNEPEKDEILKFSLNWIYKKVDS